MRIESAKNQYNQYNQTNVKNNKQTFGAAEIIMEDAKLLMPSLRDCKTDIFIKEYAEPFKNWWKDRLMRALLYRTIQEAPKEVKIMFEVSSHDPKKFNIFISKGSYKVPEIPVNLNDLSRSKNKKLEGDLTDAIKSLM